MKVVKRNPQSLLVQGAVDLFPPHIVIPHQARPGRRHGNEQVRLVTASVPIPDGHLECPGPLY